MKNNKFKEELQQMSVNDLTQKIDQLKRELFSMRLNASTAHVKDYSQFNKLRKDIARVFTYIKKKQAQ